MNKLVNNKLTRFLLSVVVAFGLWWYVISAVSPGFTDNVYNIPVVLDGEAALNEQGLMITAISHDRVSMKVSGNRSNVVKINAENTVARVDVSKIREPGSQIPMTFTPSFPGDIGSANLTVETMMPSEITLSIARRITKEIPVEVRWIGSAAEGFITDRENRTLDNSTVVISGPEEVADKIEKASIEVDLTGRTESVSENFVYTLCDEGGVPVDAQSITTNIEAIRLDVTIQQVRQINLTYNLVEGGGAREGDVTVEMNLQTLRVAGSEAALDAMGESLVVGTINLGEIARSGSVSLPITLPAGVRNLTGETEVIAEVTISGLSTKELTLTDIRPVNVPENMEAEIITKSLNVTLRGASSVITHANERCVSVSVDLSNAELGTSTYKANFSFSEGYEMLGVLHSEPISVSLKEK